MTTIDWDELLARARAVRQLAYAPYSGYRVGAAVLSASGKIYVGCNVENATYGLTICAERTAVASMVCAGEQQIAAIQVVTQGPKVGMLCGMCRQMLAEFAEELPIRLNLAEADEPTVETELSELLPQAFRGLALRRRYSY